MQQGNMPHPHHAHILFSDNYTLQINPDSGQFDENYYFFQFIGRVFAMAIYHKKLIDGRETLPSY